MTAVPPAHIDIRDLQGSAARRRRERTIRALFFAAAGLAVVISVLIVLSLIGEAIVFLTEADLGTLLPGAWQPRQGTFGVTTIIARLDRGQRSSRCWSRRPWDWAPRSTWRSTRAPGRAASSSPILEVLAAVPSVVLGFFALSVLSPTIVDRVCPGPTPLFRMASGGIAVGILITPLIASIAEDAMYAVPSSLREASYGLGARKRTTSLRVVVPSAVSGIVAALIVGGRGPSARR